MPGAAKLLERMKANPRDWRIDDLKVVANHYGIRWRQHGTSHVVFVEADGRVLPVPVRRPVRANYVKSFLKLLEG
jgi:hypothetical protein